MKRSKLLLSAAILSTIYLIYLINYFFGGIIASDDVFSAIGSGIASIFVMPHMLSVGIGVIFNWIGWGSNLKWAALVSGIMYAIAMVTMFIYLQFVLLQMIFCFVAFSKMKTKAELASLSA